MDEERPSATAEGAAVMRVLHQKLDGEPKILDDPISARLIDPHSGAYSSRVELLERLPAPTSLRLRATFVMRSRYAEDCLAEAHRDGLRQYVLLGAGLDTFAYRQPSWAPPLRIFEVDHPATQRWMRAKLAAARVQIPDNVTFAPIDFEKVSLKEGLATSDLDFGIPTFFSCLGVSMYLTKAALEETLEFVLSAPARSEIVFSFVASDAVLPADDVALAKAFTARFAAMGEPWLSRFLPEELTAKLTAMGFSKVFHLTPEKANHRYFKNRRDGLSASFLEQMMRATV
jgi:methyltransferase (TIGR00027 family)